MHYSMFEKIGLSLIIFAWIIYAGSFLSKQLIIVDDSNIDSLRLVAEESDEPTQAVTEAAAPVIEDITVLLASASADAGEKKFKGCKACHSYDKGGKNKVGPNLWNIVGRDKGSVDGFKYSNALASAGGSWSYEDLSAFLISPDDALPGTKMKFKGMKKGADRASLLLFLNVQSD